MYNTEIAKVIWLIYAINHSIYQMNCQKSKPTRKYAAQQIIKNDILQIYNFSCQNHWTFRRFKPIYIHRYKFISKLETESPSKWIQFVHVFALLCGCLQKKRTKSIDCDLLRAWKQYFLIAEHQTYIKWQFIVWCVSKSVFELRARWCYIRSIPFVYVCALCMCNVYIKQLHRTHSHHSIMLCLFDALFDSDGPCTDCGIL